MLKTYQHLLEAYILDWGLVPDGQAFSTHSSVLQPVLVHHKKAMLKIPFEKEEIRSLPLLKWWNQHGEGAVKVFRFDHQAILMERLQNDPSGLIKWVKEGKDAQATSILCEVIASLHACSTTTVVMPAGIVTLKPWFKDLFQMAEQYGGILIQSAEAASALLENPESPVLLHGDLHHENVLQSAQGKWLAIDPHGLYGERGFDYANIFCNPENQTAIAIQQFPERLAIVARESGIDKHRLLRWILAWSGLSASWFIIDGGNEGDFQLEIAKMAYKMLRYL